MATNQHDITVTLSDELDARLRAECEQLEMSREERLLNLLEYGIAPAHNLKPGVIPEGLEQLQEYLSQIPGLDIFSASEPNDARWWFKLQIDIESTIAWHVVQNLAFVLNEISIFEPLPTTFKPTSPPPLT